MLGKAGKGIQFVDGKYENVRIKNVYILKTYFRLPLGDLGMFLPQIKGGLLYISIIQGWAKVG